MRVVVTSAVRVDVGGVRFLRCAPQGTLVIDVRALTGCLAKLPPVSSGSVLLVMLIAVVHGLIW